MSALAGANLSLKAVFIYLVGNGGADALLALGAVKLNLAGVHSAFYLNDAALFTLLTGLNVAGNDVNALNDNLAFLGRSFKNFALEALIVAGYYDDSIAFFNMKLFHFNDTSILKYFGSEGEDLEVRFLTKLSCYRSENTGSYGVLIFLDNNRCVLIELDIRSVVSLETLNRTNDNCLYDVTLLYLSAGSCLLNGCYYDVADICITASGATKHADTHNLFGAGVIGNLHI